MRLARVAPADAAGHVLVHSHRVAAGGSDSGRARRIPKGTVLSAEDAEALREAGVGEVLVARLGEDDVREDEAAAALARAAAGSGLRVREPFTGRCNLVAETAGLVRVDADAVHRANAVDESLTLATLPPFSPVAGGRLVATAKVIPLAVDGGLLSRAVTALAAAGEPPVSLAPFRRARAALVLTELPGTAESLLERSASVTRRRLEALGSTLPTVARRPHDPDAVAAALAEVRESGHDLLLVLGASAVVDRDDVLPAAVRAAGGRVERLGIPVDPGNLLLLAHLGDIPVLGVPGCARSPRRNGFDHVLERVLAGVGTGPSELAGLGVGGLLAEIPSRPQPREGEASAEDRSGEVGADGGRRVAVLVLAAGRSERMGPANKLLAEVEGTPLVARAVDAALAAAVGPVVVVTGYHADAVEAALADRPVRFARNADPGAGMGASLAAGLGALDGMEGPAPAGVMVHLGDMPRVRPATLRALVDALDPDAGRSVCVPVHLRKRGNPVLWSARFLPELAGIEGDVGGRVLLGRYPEEVHEVPVDDPGVLFDVDTPEALDALHGGGGSEG